MRWHPILFSGPMIRAILDGRKTQTRRVVKPQPPDGIDNVGDGETFCDFESGKTWRSPYGYDGDRLWVRETWRSWRWNDRVKPREFAERWGDDDPQLYIGYDADNDVTRDGLTMDGKTRVSIHMPRWASRITLELTDVRVERLQEISDDDAKAEGVEPNLWADLNPDGTPRAGESIAHRAAFHELWDSINGKRGFGWTANPWVWVIEFTRVVDARVTV
jgi:hypothetical protein